MGRKSRRIKPKSARMPFVARTFQGLPDEGNWVALREFVHAGHGVVQLRDCERTVRVCSLLPAGAAGLVRDDGEILIGLGVQHNYGDVSRDLAHIVHLALSSDPGPVAMTDPGIGPRLQDLVAPQSSFDISVENNFFFWVSTDDASDISEPRTWQTGAPLGMLEAVEQANKSVIATTKLDSAAGAFLTQDSGRRWLRWILPYDESALLTALARLQAAGVTLLRGTTLIGMFRAHGLLVPVWELEPQIKPAVVDKALPEFVARLEEALADDSEVSSEVRAARQGLATRQLTVR